jgi:uncharacterized membrane protein YhaH (DUF805 family)
MRLARLLFGFNGRISRGTFWLGLAIAGLGAIAVVAVFAGLIAIAPLPTMAIEIPALIVLPPIALSWSATVLCVKRLHDRGRSGLWLIAPFAVSAAAIALMGDSPERGSALSIAIGFATVAFYGWMFVEIGLLGGESGPNRFGPDPLEPRPADAAM